MNKIHEPNRSNNKQNIINQSPVMQKKNETITRRKRRNRGHHTSLFLPSPALCPPVISSLFPPPKTLPLAIPLFFLSWFLSPQQHGLPNNQPAAARPMPREGATLYSPKNAMKKTKKNSPSILPRALTLTGVYNNQIVVRDHYINQMQLFLWFFSHNISFSFSFSIFLIFERSAPRAFIQPEPNTTKGG